MATGGDTHTPSTLIQATWPVLSLVEKEDRWEGAYLFRPNAVTATDYVRRIEGDGSYAPSAGTFVTDGTYAVAPATGSPVDTTYELHLHGFDPAAELDELLNEALKDIYVPVQAVYTPQVRITGNYLQNLTAGDGSGGVHTALSWLLHPRWVKDIRLLPASAVGLQDITFGGIPSLGAFTLGFRGVSSSSITSDPGNPAVVQTSLRLLPGLEEVSVTWPDPPETLVVVTLQGAPLEAPLLTTVANTTGTTMAITWAQTPGEPTSLSARLFLQGAEVMAECDQRFVTGDRLYVTSLVRAYDWCRASATAAFGSRSGINGVEAHEAVPIVEWVSAQMQVQAWLRNPRLMQENLEKRRCLALGDAQALAAAYQDAYLKGITVSDLLTFDVEGDPFKRPLPALLSGAGGAS